MDIFSYLYKVSRMFCAFLPLPLEFQDPVPVDMYYTLCSTPHIKNMHYSTLFTILHTGHTSLLLHSFHICAQKLLTEMDGLNQCFPTPPPPGTLYGNSYRPEEVHNGDRNSITATLFSKKCICKELLCQSVYTVRKKV